MATFVSIYMASRYQTNKKDIAAPRGIGIFPHIVKQRSPQDPAYRANDGYKGELLVYLGLVKGNQRLISPL